MLLTFPAALFWSSVACCLVAQVLIVRSVLAGRRLPAASAEVPKVRSGVEVLWVIVPAVALGVLLVFTWRAIEGHDARTAAAATETAR